ncbi:MAG: hypothetical protein ACRDRT_17900, partial [Pseudonocardiaceae bacterium]
AWDTRTIQRARTRTAFGTMTTELRVRTNPSGSVATWSVCVGRVMSADDTSSDYALLGELNRLGVALGPFTGGILTDSLSVTAQLDFGYRLIRLAGRIRARVEQKPFTAGSSGIDGEVI